MNILFISQKFPYPPYYDGMKLIAYNLIKNLSNFNKIYLITFATNEEARYIDKIAPFCEDIATIPLIDVESNKWHRFKRLIHNTITPKRFVSAQMNLEIKKAVQKWNPDVVHVDLTMISHYWKAVANLPKIISSVDAISFGHSYKNWKASNYLPGKMKAYWLYKQQRWVEKNYFPHYDACVVVSDEDRAYLKRLCPDLRIEIIPNGVDSEYFSAEYIKDDKISERPSIGLFGVMNYPPNVDAVSYFITEIYPLIKAEVPDVLFYIVGRDPTKTVMSLLDREKIVVTGEVEDFRVYYNKVSVVVIPTRIGSGIKNTVLQALSMSKPVVATSQAVRAITSAEDGVHLMVANEPVEFAKKVICLLKNRTLREEFGENARKLVVNKYSWQAHADAYHKLYSDILYKKK
jgi:sugar transferase (PEP-CTERM/EpsH1 system associated)